ncbi:MAG: anthranilate phosphoribosyltransferase [Thaumarchaeota archaeon]|nr:anthranilate phosphoribosyltransferase [Candidatus Calditenuaceae archaeon]MDW8186582.1 anthranilate phosphoribosyltransferase [Nitrososphaerota archaeon]
MIVEVLFKLVEGRQVSAEEVSSCVDEMANGTATASQIAALLTALRIRGETAELLAAMARVLRARAVKVRTEGKAIDTCGTGGDVIKTVNASTITGLIVAAGGGRVAKHGNRSYTGHTGSADLLEELGVNIDVGPEVVERCIREVGFGFMMAPRYHPSMKGVAVVRREIGIRTAFNLLGPLSNPAETKMHSMGVPSGELIPKMCDALRFLGVERAAVYHGSIGIDEVSPCSPTEVGWLWDGEVRYETLHPSDFGISRTPSDRLVVRDRREAVERAKRLISGELERGDPDVQLTLCNASVALKVVGLSDDLRYGTELAWELLSSGRVLGVLREVVRLTDGDVTRLDP